MNFKQKACTPTVCRRGGRALVARLGISHLTALHVNFHGSRTLWVETHDYCGGGSEAFSLPFDPNHSYMFPCFKRNLSLHIFVHIFPGVIFPLLQRKSITTGINFLFVARGHFRKTGHPVPGTIDVPRSSGGSWEWYGVCYSPKFSDPSWGLLTKV